ncbi:hypothetical protein BDZ97DRAFT_2025276 [Flammula alnicola]|nr:hypothetical protein BDZ97DRAFT_2025276 [Flammula alnicola]
MHTKSQPSHRMEKGSHRTRKQQHFSRLAMQPARSLHQFKRPQDVLRAVRDAIVAHKRNYMSTGTIHGNVTVDTIFIGGHPDAPTAQGFLVHPSPMTADPTFKSVMALSHTLRRTYLLPVDYLDDLESFFYVLAWMCYAYDGVVNGPPHFVPVHQRALALSRWAASPSSRESVLEKEGMLFGTGIVYGQSPVSGFWGGETYQELLDYLHYVLGSRYREKLELGRPRTIQELRSDAAEDYDAFLSIIGSTIYSLERRPTIV